MTSEFKPAYYALLIGIDRYPELPEPLREGTQRSLDSCVHDVEEIATCLKDKIKPDNLHVTLLTTSDTGSDTSTEPTFGKIISCLQEIKNSVSAGDFVYIHFSGHATRPDPGGNNERGNHEPGDLALVVLEPSCEMGYRYLWGWELAHEISAIVGGNAKVTLVLDCCCSASILRKGPGDISNTADSQIDIVDEYGARLVDTRPRFLPYDPIVAAAFPPSNGAQLLPSYQEFTPLVDRGGNLQYEYRDAAVLPTWLGKPSGYAVLAACGPDERALHVVLDNKRQGALSYFVMRAMRRVGHTGHFGHIYDDIRARLWGMVRSDGQTQNPVWYGNRDAGLFGPAAATPLGAGLVFPAVWSDDGRGFRIGGGRAHGLFEGAKLDVFAHGRKEMVVGSVGELSELTSELRLDQANAKWVKENLKGPLVKEHAPLVWGGGPVTVNISTLPDTIQAEWRDAQNLRPWLSCRDNEATFHVVYSASGNGYRILNSSSKAIEPLPGVLSDTEQALAVIEHMANYNFIKDLSNNGPTELHHEAYNIRLINLSDLRQTILADQLAMIHENDELQIIMENSGHQKLYFHVIGLCVRWNVENALRGVYKCVEPGKKGRSPKVRAEIPSNLDVSECQDHFKIFVTERPTSFQTYTMPVVGEMRKVKSEIPSGYEDKAGQRAAYSENWAVVNFSVRICKTG